MRHACIHSYMQVIIITFLRIMWRVCVCACRGNAAGVRATARAVSSGPRGTAPPFLPSPFRLPFFFFFFSFLCFFFFSCFFFLFFFIFFFFFSHMKFVLRVFVAAVGPCASVRTYMPHVPVHMRGKQHGATGPRACGDWHGGRVAKRQHRPAAALLERVS